MKEIEAPHCSLLAGETKMASEEHTRKYRLSTTLKPLILLISPKSYNFTPTIKKTVDLCRRFFASPVFMRDYGR